MKISKKVLSLILVISMVFSIIPNSFVSAAENSSDGNTYQDSSHDSSVDSGTVDNGEPVTGIILNKTNLTLENGNSETLTATVTPADAADQTVFWITSNSRVCTVDQDGAVTAEGNGSAVITVMADDGGFTAKCKVNVITSTAGITINKTNITLAKGSNETLIAKVIPSGASSQDINWSSSNENICTVDSSGKVSALNVGTAIVSAATKDSGYTASCLVTVIAPVTGVTLNKTELTLENGKSETLTAAVTPSEATNQKISWSSSNNSVCTVDQSGKVTAIRNGSANITVATSDGNFTAECKVNVITPVTGIMINKTNLTISKGSKETLIATVTPADASQQDVVWSSSDENVCTVDSSGEVEALSVGTAVIYAATKDSGYKTACDVTVVIPATGITLNKTELTLENGTSETLVATVTPSDATYQGTLWSTSNNSVCTVDQNGKVTAVNNGSAVIIVTTYDRAFTVKCNVNVITSMTGITLNKSCMTLSKGSQETLLATVTPAGASQKDVLWSSSDETVCTVDSSGNVASLSGGTAVISATTKDGGYTAKCSVTVTTPVTSVTLNKSDLTLENGKTEALAATVNPSGATNQNITWESSNSSVCSVDENGNVTAVGNGSAVITVKTDDGGFTATCNVNVITYVTGITLNKTKMTLTKGSAETLTATVSPAGASQQDVLWSSSDENICTVDSSGNITALNVGTAEISATTKDGNYTAKCAVTVEIPVSGVTLNKTEITLEKGFSEYLSATTTPADATNQKMVWVSSNKTVCTVNQSGKITAVANGTAVITVMTLDQGFTAECNVTVITSVTGVTLNKARTTLVKGSKETLTATITPESASDKSILWSSSDENVCTVDSSGNITAINAGTADITVTTKDGGFTAKCAVTVVIPVTGITVNPSTLTIIKGNSQTLTATVTPNDATNKSLSWSSSNENIAVVDQSGKVTAVSVGTATITVTTKDGGFTATTSVTVKPNTYTVTASTTVGGTISGNEKIYKAGSTVTLTAVPDLHYHFVNWTNASGTVISTGTTYTINNLSADTTVNANFAVDTFTVSISAGAGGSVSGAGTYTYAYGTEITLSATPSYGYDFLNWSDGNTSQSRPNYTVTGNISLIAIFKVSAITWTSTTQITDNTNWTWGTSPSPGPTSAYAIYAGGYTGNDKNNDDPNMLATVTYTFNQAFLMTAGSTFDMTAYWNSAPNHGYSYFNMYINGNYAMTSGGSGYSAYKGVYPTYKVKSDTWINSITLTESFQEDLGHSGSAYQIIHVNSSMGTFMLNNSGTSIQ
jgi:uncharacterized protein YjdB